MSGEPPSLEPSTAQPRKSGRTRESLATVRLIVAALVALYAIAFIVLNTHSTKVDFVFTSTNVSVIWVILLSLAIGAALGVLVVQLRRRRQRKN
jgi:uncharacterized integral membrane protein